MSQCCLQIETLCAKAARFSPRRTRDPSTSAVQLSTRRRGCVAAAFPRLFSAGIQIRYRWRIGRTSVEGSRRRRLPCADMTAQPHPTASVIPANATAGGAGQARIVITANASCDALNQAHKRLARRFAVGRREGGVAVGCVRNLRRTARPGIRRALRRNDARRRRRSDCVDVIWGVAFPSSA